MITQRVFGVHHITMLCQLLLASLLYWAQVYSTNYFYSALPESGFQRYFVYYACIILGIFMAGYGDKRHEQIQENMISCNRKTFRQICFIAGFLMIFLVATKDPVISRFFLITFMALLYLLLFITNYKLPTMVAVRLFRGVRTDRALLIGYSSKLSSLRPWLKMKEALGISVSGVLSGTTKTKELYGFPVLGELEDLEQVILNHDITQVILVDFAIFKHTMGYLIGVCEKLGVRLLVINNMEDLFHHQVTYIEDGGFHFVGLREEPLENPFNRLSKRTLDIVVALGVVVFILPFTSIFVWILHLLQSRGPLFYTQYRAGVQNQPFRIIKYRSMYTDNDNESRQASKNDDRVFPLGHFIRRFSIDELPQFINVLLGHMSVVGPRPHLLEHNDSFARAMSNYHVRTFVKPGITGLAQVRGFRGETRSLEDVQKRLHSDIHYLENWSLSLDIAIIVRTAWQAVFPPRMAY